MISRYFSNARDPAVTGSHRGDLCASGTGDVPLCHAVFHQLLLNWGSVQKRVFSLMI